MSEHTWAELPDDQLDDMLRGEMAVLRATVSVPRVDARALGRSRTSLRRVDPAVPRRAGLAALAVGLAVLLAAGSGTWFAVQRLHGRSATPATTPDAAPTPVPTTAPTTAPTAAASATPLPSTLTSTVPGGVPVFWYTSRTGQPNGALRLEALDWSGARRGHLDIPGMALPQDASTGLGILQSPDGERLLLGDTVYSSDGHRLYLLPPGTPGRVRWADDSRTICMVSGAPVPGGGGGDDNELVVLDGNGTPRSTVSVLGRTGDDALFAVEGCSVTADRVVSYVQVSSAATEVQVNRLGSNQQLLKQTLCTTGTCGYNLGNISVSADCRVAAESDMDGHVRIRDLTTGRVRNLSARGGVLQISADGTRLLLGRPSFDFSNHSYPLTLLDVATGRVLWTHAQEGVLGSDTGSQPGGSAIAVAYHDIDLTATPGPNNYMPLTRPSTLVLLRGGGATTVATGVHSMFYGWF